jgi:hypothetical protein
MSSTKHIIRAAHRLVSGIVLFLASDFDMHRTEPIAIRTVDHSCRDNPEIRFVQIYQMPALRALVNTFPLHPILSIR